MDCSILSKKRRDCHNLYGKLGEDCLVQELEEKRCLSFRHCTREARAYYGSANGTKALCSAWTEAFTFTNECMDQHVRERHEKATEIVNKSPGMQRECRAVAMGLAKCMMNKKVHP